MQIRGWNDIKKHLQKRWTSKREEQQSSMSPADIKKETAARTSEPTGSDKNNQQTEIYTTEDEMKDAAAREEEARLAALKEEQNRVETEEVTQLCEGMKKNNVWAFCAGQYSNDFRGNPKYLFLYINNYRKDVLAYWLCDDENIIQQIRELGFRAYKVGTPQAETMISHTGVLVAEQVKAFIPDGLTHAKYLNLWHGVGGVKAVERKIKTGRLLPEIAKKYINRNEYYREYELYLAPSKFIEEIAKKEIGLTEKQIVRAGYPRCIYQKQYKKIATYDHDILKQKGLPEDTRIAAYTPTYRNDANAGELFANAVPDIEELLRVCEKEHIFMIFKMHPLLEKEQSFLWAKEKYADNKWCLFWDNANDFYEILDQIDLCIMDYSSIFTDFIAAGCKHFIRYAFDFDGEDLEFPMDYDEVTPGRKCKTFDELLAALATYEADDIQADLERIGKLYWEYADADSMDRIVDSTLAFEPKKPELPTLYSFDIFDTLFSRKVLDPMGIFFAVREKMQADGGFPYALVQNYPSVRKMSETNVREYYKKTTALRQSETVEIQFDEIFDRIAPVYGLSDEQVQKLKNWELETEFDNVIPLPEQIDRVKELLAKKETVVLVSDMYLSREVVRKLLAKADPVLAELPLFLSSDYGVQKVSQKLFFEVYGSFEPYYDFKKWIHYGDNPIADHNPPRKIGIQVRVVNKPQFSDIQRQMVETIGTYDAYLVAALQTRMADASIYSRDAFVATYVTLCMVPYVDWAIRDAVRRGYQTLYFISRDGHPLKRIADAIIKARGLQVKTKYIYASRRTWRIPSFIREVDREFWEPYGSFGNITSEEKLLKAMDLTQAQFHEFFPTVVLDDFNYTDKKELNGLIDIFKKSEAYNQFLMKKGAEERVLVRKYLEQEIDRTERFAFVEYWGRGYTQDCFVRLWHDIVGEEVDVPYYYSRTVLPTIGHSVRYNFTTNSAAQFFMEGIFANMPYKSVEKYQLVDGRVEPVIVPVPHDTALYDSMQRLLPEFAERYAGLSLTTPEDTDHMLYEFALNYYSDNRANPEFAEQIGGLVDSVSLYGKKREFAPPFTMELLDEFAEKKKTRGMGSVTTSISMSVIRATEEVKKRYFEMYQIMPGDDVASGRLLSEHELEVNRKYKEKYKKIKARAEMFAELYDHAAEANKITNTILFVTNAKNFTSGYLRVVADRLKEDARFKVVMLRMGNTEKTDEEIAQMTATARYLIIPTSIQLFCKTSFREGTEMIMLRDNAFNLYNQGYVVKYFLKWKQKYFDYVLNNDTDILQVPSEYQKEIFDLQFSPKEKDRMVLYGNCSTDMYFDEAFLKNAKEHLTELFPEAKNKQVMLYMPTLRKVNSSGQWAKLFDMNRMRQLVGDRYVVVVSLNPGQLKDGYKNVLEVDGFSRCINKKTKNGMAIRELMVAADVIVGDYRDTFFETPILRKPAYSTACDYENIIKGLNISIHANAFDENLFCPIVETEEELADQLQKVDQYDFTLMDQFREKMFSACDGHSIDRVCEYLTSQMEQKR